MPTGSGLDAQLVIGQESIFGTAVVPDRALEFNEESLVREYEWIEPTGLRAGLKYKRASRIIASRTNVTGSFSLEHATRGMGLLWKHLLASSGVATQIGATTAYEQVHVPGDFRGKSLTVQVGRPEPSTGTVVPFTYSGVKVTDWTLTVSDNEIATLEVNVDGRNETTATALVVPSYIAGAGVFGFHQAVLKLGGTASTASGKTSISGGTTVATIINEFSASGESPKATERFGLGSAGLKAEQLENDIPTFTGSLSAEFNKTEFYDVYANKATTALQLIITGDAIGVSGSNDLFELTYPAVKFKTANPAVGGPDIVAMDTDFEAYSDGTNPVMQVRLISADTVI